MEYQTLKLIHIISATIMFGTGLGSAFYLFYAYKFLKFSTVKDVLDIVIFADYIFTTPSVLLQLISGIWLSQIIGLFTTKWFVMVLASSFFVFGLWVRAVFVQIKMKTSLQGQNDFSQKFHQLMKEWFYLGVPAFIGSLIIFYLMVFKPFF